MSIFKERDPATSHFHKEVKDFFNCKSPEKRIDKAGPITWLPCYPDIIPINLGGGCATTLATTMPQLARTVRTAVATVILDLLKKAITENEYSYDICWASESVPTEHQ
jgi:hypothetical protein